MYRKIMDPCRTVTNRHVNAEKVGSKQSTKTFEEDKKIAIQKSTSPLHVPEDNIKILRSLRNRKIP